MTSYLAPRTKQQQQLHEGLLDCFCFVFSQVVGHNNEVHVSDDKIHPWDSYLAWSALVLIHRTFVRIREARAERESKTSRLLRPPIQVLLRFIFFFSKFDGEFGHTIVLCVQLPGYCTHCYFS